LSGSFIPLGAKGKKWRAIWPRTGDIIKCFSCWQPAEKEGACIDQPVPGTRGIDDPQNVMARRNDAAGPREGDRDDFPLFSPQNLMEKYQPVVEDVAAVVKSVGGSQRIKWIPTNSSEGMYSSIPMDASNLLGEILKKYRKAIG
jgi:hypothetical protein